MRCVIGAGLLGFQIGHELLAFRDIVLLRELAGLCRAPGENCLDDGCVLGEDFFGLGNQCIARVDIEACLLCDELVLLAEATMPGQTNDRRVKRKVGVGDGQRVSAPAGSLELCQGAGGCHLRLIAAASGGEPRGQRLQARSQGVELPGILGCQARHFPPGIGDLMNQPLGRELVQGSADRGAGDGQLRG